jgi:putative flippase GtrA
MVVSLVASLRARIAPLKQEIAKFGIVGAAAFIVDFGLFNALSMPAGPLAHKVLTSKAIATIAATTFAYFANRHWTWRHRTRSGLAREYVLFFVFNGIGLGIMEACLAISRYGMGFDTALSNNISAYGFGLVLGTIFRFWAYRRYVFMEARTDERDDATPAVV